MVEHVAEHQHTALHPLPGAGELRMIELSHGAVTIEHSKQHVRDRVATEAVALGEIIDDPLTFRGKLLHVGYHVNFQGA